VSQVSERPEASRRVARSGVAVRWRD